MDSQGNFVIAWQSYAQDGSSYGIFAQRYASSGTRLGTEFQVNNTTAYWQGDPSVTASANGDFVVVWSGATDGSAAGIFGRRFLANGRPDGMEFQVNTFAPSMQVWPAVASNANGNVVVAWTSYDQDGSSSGIFAQRFGMPPTPTPRVPCTADCNSDGAVTVNELVLGVTIALGAAPITTCRAMDADGDGAVSIDELVRAVAAALGEC